MLVVTSTETERIFIPCSRCDGDGAKSFWPGGICFKCDGRKGEWVDAKVYARRLAAREKAAAKRDAVREVRYAELVARRAANWKVWAAENPEYAARIEALPDSSAKTELVRYVGDRVTVYQTWEEMISRVEAK